MWKRSAGILWLVGYNLETRIPRRRIGRRIIRAEWSSAEPSNNPSLWSTAGKECAPWSEVREVAPFGLRPRPDSPMVQRFKKTDFGGFRDGKLYSDNFFTPKLLGHTLNRTNTMEFTQIAHWVSTHSMTFQLVADYVMYFQINVHERMTRVGEIFVRTQLNAHGRIDWQES